MTFDLYPPFRDCRFCISLENGCVFADFDVDRDGRVYLRRMSFDGHGCWSAPDDVARMTVEGSSTLVAMVEGVLDEARIEAALRSYFAQLAPLAWPDVFAEYDLI